MGSLVRELLVLIFRKIILLNMYLLERLGFLVCLIEILRVYWGLLRKIYVIALILKLTFGGPFGNIFC